MIMLMPKNRVKSAGLGFVEKDDDQELKCQDLKQRG